MEQTIKPQVSVVIPNFNNASYLQACLETVCRSPGVKEIIAVDDNSSDNSIELIKRFPVQLVRNNHNLGPVKSRNIGAQKAAGEFILFLDSDVALEPDYIPLLVSFMNTHPYAGAVSGRIVSKSGERIWYNFGYDPARFRDFVANVIHGMVLKSESHKIINAIMKKASFPFTQNFVSDRLRKVNWVIEMALMARRSVFQKIGGFDEDFFMFYEGPDLCLRIRKAGSDVYYIPQAVVRDLGSHSHNASSRTHFFEDSRKKYFSKYGWFSF